MNSYDYLKNIKPNSFIPKIVIVLIIILTVYLSHIIKIFDTYTIVGEISSNLLTIKIPIINSDIIENGNFINIEDNSYTYKIINKTKSYYIDLDEYQTYTLKINNDYKTNTYKVITFYYNQETIIKKIKNIVF